MDSPSIHKDESLILSTHHILVGTSPFDLMLTSRRLILIDIRSVPFVLHSVPLVTVMTVTGSTGAGGEPVISLSYTSPDGSVASRPLDLIFSPVPAGERTREWREWIQKLQEHTAAAREAARQKGTLPYDMMKVVQPQGIHTRRIETVLPHKRVFTREPGAAEPAIPPAPGEFSGTPGESPEPTTPAVPGDQEPAWISVPGDAVTGTAECAPPEVTENPDGEELFEQDPAFTATLASMTGESFFYSTGAPDGPDHLPPEASLSGTQAASTEHEEDVLPVPQADAGAPQVSDQGAETATPFPAGSNVPAGSGFAGSPERETGTAVTGTPDNPAPEEPVTSRNEEPGAPGSKTAEPSGAGDIWADAARVAESLQPVLPGLPSGEEPVHPALREDPGSAETFTAAAGAPGDTPPLPEPAQPPASRPPVPPTTHVRWPVATLGAVIIILILAITGGIVMASLYLHSPAPGTPVPGVIPSAVEQPVPSPQISSQPAPSRPVPSAPVPGETGITVPETGVWVRVVCPGIYFGAVGNPDLMKPVRGSGETVYSIRNSEGIVQVSLQKEENSGDLLTVEVYKNGTLIKRSTTRVPRGTIDILIDAKTANPPGIPAGETG